MTFQSQLDAAAGGSVLIDPGVYNEGNLNPPANTFVRMPNVEVNSSGFTACIAGTNGGVTFQGTGNPGGPVAERGQFLNANEYAVGIPNRENLTFTDLHVANWAVTLVSLNQSVAAFQFNRSGGATVRRCRMAGEKPTLCNGIWVKRDGSGLISVIPHYFADNEISGCYDGIGGESEDHDQGGFTPFSVIERNYVHDCFDDGIQAEGRGEEVWLLHNTVERCGIGFALAPVRIGPIFMFWNRVLDGVDGNNNAIGVKLGRAGTGLITAMYNLIDHRNSAIFNDSIGFQQTDTTMQPIVAKHNRLYVGRYAWDLNFDPLPVGSDVDFNRYYVHVGSSGNRFKWDGTAVADLAAWRTASGHDANSVYSEDMQTIP